MAQQKITVELAACWVLRIGLFLSVTAMVCGTALSFMHNNLSLDRMQHAAFESDPRIIWNGLCQGRGQAVIELGIYLLVLTPIMRVVTSAVIFAFVERNWLYVVITLIGLMLTLTGLLVLR